MNDEVDIITFLLFLILGIGGIGAIYYGTLISCIIGFAMLVSAFFLWKYR